MNAQLAIPASPGVGTRLRPCQDQHRWLVAFYHPRITENTWTCKILNLLLKIAYAFGHILSLVNGQILRKLSIHLTITTADGQKLFQFRLFLTRFDSQLINSKLDPFFARSLNYHIFCLTGLLLLTTTRSRRRLRS